MKKEKKDIKSYKTRKKILVETPSRIKLFLPFVKVETSIYLKNILYYIYMIIKKQKLTKKQKLELNLLLIGIGVYLFLLTSLGTLFALFVAKFGLGWI